MSSRRRFNCWMGWHEFIGDWDPERRYTRCRHCRGWFRLTLEQAVPREKDAEAQDRARAKAEELNEIIGFVRHRASEASPKWATAQMRILHMLEGTVYEERAAQILADQHQEHPDHRGKEWAP